MNSLICCSVAEWSLHSHGFMAKRAGNKTFTFVGRVRVSRKRRPAFHDIAPGPALDDQVGPGWRRHCTGWPNRPVVSRHRGFGSGCDKKLYAAFPDSFRPQAVRAAHMVTPDAPAAALDDAGSAPIFLARSHCRRVHRCACLGLLAVRTPGFRALPALMGCSPGSGRSPT